MNWNETLNLIKSDLMASPYMAAVKITIAGLMLSIVFDIWFTYGKRNSEVK